MSDYINENLLGASPYKSQAAEAKKLVSKWDKTGLLDGLNEDFKKSGMAVMLENQAKQLINENTFTGGGTSAATGGAGSEEWSGVALPLVRRIFGEIAAQDFVSVQPMNLQELVVEPQAVQVVKLVLKSGLVLHFHWFVESLVRLQLKTLYQYLVVM